jgi:hypothetical protein
VLPTETQLLSINYWNVIEIETILHQLGIHYEDLYAMCNGLKERLTGVNEACVVREVLA